MQYMNMMDAILYDGEVFFSEPEAVNHLNKNGLRYIDFAARLGRVNTLIDLIEKHGACIEKNKNSSWTNLFFWMSYSINVEERRDMYLWLKKKERYQQLKCDVSDQHLNAVLETFSPYLLEESSMCRVDSFGLSPLHYYVLANTIDSDENRMAHISSRVHFFNQPLTKGLQGATGLWVLVECRRWGLCKFLIKCSVSINANAKPLGIENSPFIVWTLTEGLFKEYKWSMLEDVVAKSDSVDADAETIVLQGGEKRVTLALALSVEGKMKSLKFLLEKTNAINANVKIEGEEYTLARRLLNALAWNNLTLLMTKASSLVDFEMSPQDFKAFIITLFQSQDYRLIAAIFDKAVLPENFVLGEAVRQNDRSSFLNHILQYPETDSLELYHALFPQEDVLKEFTQLLPLEKVYVMKHRMQALIRMTLDQIKAWSLDNFLEEANKVLKFFYLLPAEELIESVLMLLSLLKEAISQPNVIDAMSYDAIFRWSKAYAGTLNLESLSLVDRIDIEKTMLPLLLFKMSNSAELQNLGRFLFCMHVDILSQKNNEIIRAKEEVSAGKTATNCLNNPSSFYSFSPDEEEAQLGMMNLGS